MRFRYQRWMIFTALVYLAVGLVIGLLMFLGYRYPAWAWIYRWRIVHVHLILVGGIIQMIMGVALWMFPRKREPPGWTSEGEGLTLYALFNSGTVSRSLAEPFWADATWCYFAALAGIGLQILALGYFLVLIWQRVRAPRSAA